MSGRGPDDRELKDLPPFCRVVGIVDQEIRFEVWLPPTGSWNGKYHGVGIGGFAGSISYVASHTSLVSKNVIAAFYRAKPKISTFAGCSGGGRQGLVEATRFPTDYDAIVAFAPTDLELAEGFLMRATAASHRDQAAILGPQQIDLTLKTIFKQCDGNDGLVDGSIGDPRRCDFKPAQLLCKKDQTQDCLSAAQVKGLEEYYQPLTDSRGSTQFPGSGENFFAAQAPGTGASPRLQGGEQPFAFWVDFGKLLQQDRNWDWRSMNPGLVENWVRTSSPRSQWTSDFDAFKARGGKLILIQGWADFGITPETTITFYKKILAKEQEKLGHSSSAASESSFMRLFLAPDTDHCMAGIRGLEFDALAAVDSWRETEKPPTTILAWRESPTAPSARRERPLCPFPAEAIYKGTGSVDRASSFTCGVRAPRGSLSV
jgi:feruloyl esterase